MIKHTIIALLIRQMTSALTPYIYASGLDTHFLGACALSFWMLPDLVLRPHLILLALPVFFPPSKRSLADVWSNPYRLVLNENA